MRKSPPCMLPTSECDTQCSMAREAEVAGGRQIGDNAGMRLAKLALACLICLGVTLQGFASVVSVEAPCPMTGWR